jgi:putative ABC transport system permease protein
MIGFIVGLMISYQILYTELSNQESQYATLKAMGYGNAYLVRVVLTQSAFYGIVGFLPAAAVAMPLFRLIGEKALLPMHLGLGISGLAFALTLGMCLSAGALAVRRVIEADPAEIF